MNFAQFFNYTIVTLVSGAIVNFIMLLSYELQHYLNALAPYKLSLLDIIIVAFILYWKSSIFMLLGYVIGAGWCLASAKIRGPMVVWLLGVSISVVYVVADIKIQQRMGTNFSVYLASAWEIIRAGDFSLLQNAGDIGRDITVGMLVFTAVFFLVFALYQLLKLLLSKFSLPLTNLGVGILVVKLVLFVAIFVVQAFVSDQRIIDRLRSILPCQILELPAYFQDSPSKKDFLSLLAISTKKPDNTKVSIFHLYNYGDEDLDLSTFKIKSFSDKYLPLSGVIAKRSGLDVLVEQSFWLSNIIMKVWLVGPDDEIIDELDWKREWAVYGVPDRIDNRRSMAGYALDRTLSRKIDERYASLYADLKTVKPIDLSLLPSERKAKNIILFILESFRESAVSPHGMAELNEWAKNGMRATNFYSGSNASHLGVFSLLYSRNPLFYDDVLDQKLQAQLPATMKASGFETYYFSSAHFRSWKRMGEFVNHDVFDNIVERNSLNQNDWPSLDKNIIEQAAKLIEDDNGAPKFIVVFLMSTHWPYVATQEYAASTSKDPLGSKSRYLPATLTLEKFLMNFIKRLPKDRDLVLITGDHGESLGEDGTRAHLSAASESQLRVPFLMVGPGVAAQTITEPTTHLDVLPTAIHALLGREHKINNIHGYDLLAKKRPPTIMLQPMIGNVPQILIIDNNRRALFEIERSEPRAKFIGFVNELGKIDPEFPVLHSYKNVEEWKNIFEREFSNL